MNLCQCGQKICCVLATRAVVKLVSDNYAQRGKKILSVANVGKTYVACSLAVKVLQLVSDNYAQMGKKMSSVLVKFNFTPLPLYILYCKSAFIYRK